jgi:ketosteroid isomerase-like protein
VSRENVEVVRKFFAMIDCGNDEAWDLLPADFIVDLSRRLLDPVILRGPGAMRAFYRDLDATWADGASLEIEELIDAGDKVLVLIRYGGRGKMSGVGVEALVWNLWAFRGGRPDEWTYFGEDRPAALEAAGLSE